MKNIKIGIIGLGYVGIPLAIEFGKKFTTIGFDINPDRVNELNNGVDRTKEVSKKNILSATKLIFTCDNSFLKHCNYYVIAVPTPVDNKNIPNLKPLKNSTKLVGELISKGDIVIYESTVYPGVTEDICAKILEKESGLIFNKDFFCGYSPERINPGDKKHNLKKVIKITSGSNHYSANKIDKLYNSIIDAGTYKAPSIKVAEAAKIIENAQRDVNIALINELALIFDRMNINTHEVINAAKTKWNFIDFRPGLVGGHCIGVDPYYLIYKSKKLGYKPNLLLDARNINNKMSKFVIQKFIYFAGQRNISIKKLKVLVLGITFKENCPDIRNSKIINIVNDLIELGCDVNVYDPWVNKDEKKKNFNHRLINNPFSQKNKYDAFIVSVAHNEFKKLKRKDYIKISKHKDLFLMDIKGIYKQSIWSL